MDNPTEPVSITILERKYQFACTPEERQELIAAAANLDQRMEVIKESGRLMSLERITLQAALNLSHELIKMQQDSDFRKDKIDSKIRMLADQLDDALTRS